LPLLLLQLFVSLWALLLVLPGVGLVVVKDRPAVAHSLIHAA
jgi:hypothetical protein